MRRQKERTNKVRMIMFNIILALGEEGILIS